MTASPATWEATIKDHVILNDDPTARENLIGLAQVSTDVQELARQIDALKTAGCARIYLDKASGKQGTTRPGLTTALDHMRRGDTLVVLDVTRLGRDTRELLAIVEDHLHAQGRRFRTLDGIDDDVLALMFVSCHPVLSPEARVALTLRVVGGLSGEEIARAFLVPVPTVQARITRGKKTIAAAGVPFELPPAAERRERLGGVLSVLYVIFTEGSTATSGDRLLRPDVAYEAIRLARTLAALQPDEPEVHGLLALCELTAARFPARTGPDGSPVLLEDQDRRRWDFSAIRRGLDALAKASTRGLGPYGLQAAIAATHASAPSVEATDWDRIVVLYEALGRVAPSPVVELNRAVAVAMASGPAQALAMVDELIALDRLPGSHLVPTVRGELLARLGRRPEARAELELAARLCANQHERSVLLRKAAALG
ncbi:RNA polymerase sigma factor [Nonomuraea sp. 3N208]|uniref:RNA polymerase sigma factor n=1 Tax=Nonomuraea sp. 3N208 TaxID=3457421 RepID=UPI003FD57722